MDHFVNIVRWAGRVGTAVGASFLVGIMLLIVANVFYRFFGRVIAGTYELTELFIVVVIAFALGYTALEKGHIVINIVVSRFPLRTQAILESLTSVIGLGIWALIAWASFGFMCEKALQGEQSRLLELSYLPFRCVWVFGLLLFCLVLLTDLFKALSRAGRKK